MNTTIALAALFSAGAVAALAYRAAKPPRGIAAQISPYTAIARSRLGVEVESLPEPLYSGEVLRRVLGPLGHVLAGRAAKILGLADRSSLDLRLRRAGQPMTVEGYRRRHLQYVVAAPIAATLIGWAFGSTFMVVLFLAGGAFVGARRMPDRLADLTRRRNARMRSDLPTVAWMLTPRIRNRMTVSVAVADLVAEGSGPVIDDLGRALQLISAGYSETAAFELAVKETVEPAAARFYSLLAVAATGGIDLAPALLDLSRELRIQRREEVERASARRQIAMVLPDLACMAPVLILFILAPVPRLLFGTA